MIKMRKAQEASFTHKEKYTPRNKKERALLKAFMSRKDEKGLSNLVRDLFTPAEIEEFANRLEIARLLYDGHSYQEIADKTKVSTTTVTRVAHWLFNGCGGYYQFLSEEKSKK